MRRSHELVLGLGMLITLLNGNVPIPLKDFSRLLSEHLQGNPDTTRTEFLGDELAQTDFPANKIPEFVKYVCKWGGYPGIGGRILKRNTHSDIAEALKSAWASLAVGKLASALAHVNQLSGLGGVSFASKHLRFLRPDICPVFDSILHEVLPYPFDASGYATFARDCSLLPKLLAENQIVNPKHREGRVWFVADVEGAIFKFVDQSRTSHRELTACAPSRR